MPPESLFRCAGDNLMPDFELVCADCAEMFIFDEKEQRIFRDRKMRAPRRCKSCRHTHQREYVSEDGMPMMRVDTAKKVTYAAVCDQCGKPSQVPFKPAPGRAVLCYDCYNARRANTMS